MYIEDPRLLDKRASSQKHEIFHCCDKMLICEVVLCFRMLGNPLNPLWL